MIVLHMHTTNIKKNIHYFLFTNADIYASDE